MKVTGIITEYNPFHNGHMHHLTLSRQRTDADYIVVVMSGNYTQRGIPALMDKYLRTQMALENGADLVLELPLLYATGSAEYFSTGAVTLLDKLGVVDSLCFGSECGTIAPFMQIATLLNKESKEYTSILQEALKRGDSFPIARKNALLSLSPAINDIEEILSSPNNILGIEYIKALQMRNSSIVPYTIKRIGSDYNSSILEGERSSALAIRQSLLSNTDIKQVKSQVPTTVFSVLDREWQKSYPIFADDFSLMLQYKLLSCDSSVLASFMDMSSDLSDKVKKNLKNFTSYNGFCDTLKSKDITYTRLSRCLLHTLLDITKEDLKRYKSLDYIPYARILGFKKESSELLGTIKENASIPMISKLADAPKVLSSDALSMLEKEITASHIYEAVVSQKFKQGMNNEYTRQIVIV